MLATFYRLVSPHTLNEKKLTLMKTKETQRTSGRNKIYVHNYDSSIQKKTETFYILKRILRQNIPQRRIFS